MAARYRVALKKVTPLRIQLGSNSCVAELQEVYAEGYNTLGSASRPVIYRPSTPGTSSNPAAEAAKVVDLVGMGRTPISSTITTTFGKAPTYPLVLQGSFDLPMRVLVSFDKGKGILLGPDSYLVLYATAILGHYWDAAIEWEEL